MKTPTKRMHAWRAEIPEVPPSGNVILRTHFRQRKEQKGIWYCLIYGAFFHEGITQAKRKRSVTITLRSQKQRDEPNNALPADKYILDNLKALGWIVDDSPKWCEVTINTEIGQPRTIIEVRE